MARAVKSIGPLLLLLLLVTPFAALAEERVLATVHHVVDGDTIHAFVQGKKEKIRFIGIDAPETKMNDHAARQMKRFGIGAKRILKLGKAADLRLREILRPGYKVKLEFDKNRNDSFGRTLAYVYTSNGEFINATLVREGMAWAIAYKPNVRHQKQFEALEKSAKERKAGIWE